MDFLGCTWVKWQGVVFGVFFGGLLWKNGNFRIEYVPTENPWWGDLMMIFHDDQKHLSSSQVHGIVPEKWSTTAKQIPKQSVAWLFKIMFSVFLDIWLVHYLIKDLMSTVFSQILFPDAHPKDEDAYHLFPCFPHWSIRQKVIIPQYIVILIRHYHNRDPLFIDQNKEISKVTTWTTCRIWTRWPKSG